MKGIPEQKGIADYLALLRGADKSAENKKQAQNMALMNAGFTMMSAPTRNFGMALGAGAQAGLQTYSKQDLENRREAEALRKDMGLASIAQDQQNIARYGIGRQNLRDQANLMHQNEQGRFNAAQLGMQDKWHADQNATTIKAAGIRAAREGANSPAALELKFVTQARTLYSNTLENARKAIADNPRLAMHPEKHAAFIQDKMREAFRANPHLAEYANVDISGGGGGGYMAEPPGGVKVFGAK